MKTSFLSGLLLAMFLTAAAMSVNHTAGGTIGKASYSGATTEVTFYGSTASQTISYDGSEAPADF